MGLAGVLGVLVFSLALGSQAARLAGPPPASTDLPYREITGDGESPSISFIDSPSATCYLPVPGTGACYIQWDYLNVTAAPGSYIISMTLSIDDHIRAYHSGFFQTSMYIPEDMTSPGYQVTCGWPGTGGTLGYGEIYNYTIRARDTAGLKAANYGTTTCPVDTIKVYLPLLVKH
jgi:hypothetical protein